MSRLLFVGAWHLHIRQFICNSIHIQDDIHLLLKKKENNDVIRKKEKKYVSNIGNKKVFLRRYLVINGVWRVVIWGEGQSGR